MYKLAASPRNLQDTARPKDPAIITMQRVRRQLEIVVELFEHNIYYLTTSEQSWIENIIDEAVLVALDPRDSVPTFPPSSNGLNISANGLLNENMGTHRRRSESKSSSVAGLQEDLNSMLLTSKSLNSANNLLACCYDRWFWLQSSQIQQKDPQANADDLQQLLKRQRMQQRRWRDVVPQTLEFLPSPQRHATDSTASSRVVTASNDGSERSLCLIVNETIDKWRTNAEEALNETTARMQTIGTTGGYHSPTNKQIPHPYTNRSYVRSGDYSPFKPGIDDLRLPIMNAGTYSQQSRNMSPSYPAQDPQTQSVIATGYYDQNLLTRSPQSQQFDPYNSVQPAFKPTLFNSFDKEIISVGPKPTNYKASTYPPIVQPIESSLYPRSDTSLCEASSKASQTTLIPVEPGTTIFHGLTERNGPHSTQRKNISTSSVQSHPSDGGDNSRSRGRRWLEQQSLGLPR